MSVKNGQKNFYYLPLANSNGKPERIDLHTLTLIRRTDTFTDWQCPICGRYIVVMLHPFRIEVIQAGDGSVTHSGMSLDFVINE